MDNKTLVVGAIVVAAAAGAVYWASTGGLPGLSADTPPPAYVSDAVASTGRPPADLARDEMRKPAKVVAFAGVKPGDKVLEFFPGGGYYTRILSKAVGENGRVYAFVPLTGPPPWSPDAIKAAADAGRPPPRNPIAAVRAIAHIAEYKNVQPILQAGITGYGGNIGLPEQVDVVWTSNNYHDYHNAMMGPLDMAVVNKALLRTLKPGGTYFIVDYAAKPGSGFADTQTMHRSDKDAVKKEVTDAGFEFVGESNVLANPADDHSKGSNNLGYKSDQYILKFKKPDNADAGDKRPATSEIQPYFGNTFVLGTPNNRFRTIFYHEDGSYQEFGMNDMQSAHWYWAADGQNCMYHEAPAVQEGFVTCHPWADEHRNAKMNETFTEVGGNGQGALVTLVPGYVYPNTSEWPKEKDN